MQRRLGERNGTAGLGGWEEKPHLRLETRKQEAEQIVLFAGEVVDEEAEAGCGCSWLSLRPNGRVWGLEG